MTVFVRDLRPEARADAEGFAHVRHLALPFMLSTPDVAVHRLEHSHPDAHFRLLVAEEDGEVIGTTQVGIVHDSMTGPARAYRGRGLAKLAKNDSLHCARAAGYTEAFTGNDADNGPALAINKWFGYEICATEVRHVRELG